MRILYHMEYVLDVVPDVLQVCVAQIAHQDVREVVVPIHVNHVRICVHHVVVHVPQMLVGEVAQMLVQLIVAVVVVRTPAVHKHHNVNQMDAQLLVEKDVVDHVAVQTLLFMDIDPRQIMHLILTILLI